MKRPISESQFLVTGAAGFVGAHVAGQLLDAGAKIVGIDNLNDYYDPTLKQHRVEVLQKNQAFEFHEMDVENLGDLGKLFDNNAFDGVINLAARAGVRASVKDPHIYLQTNAQGTLNILEQMRAHSVPKLVLASTSSLYAGQSMPFVETTSVSKPISPYAASKKAAEVMAYTYHSLFDIDVSVVRYFTVYGTAGRPDMSPYRFINWIATGHPIQLYGDGSQSRDFTYIDDIAGGTIAALKSVGYEIFNLGGNTPYSLLQMIEKIERLVGRKAKIDFLPAQATDMAATWANAEKAREVLGWEAKIDFDEGLARTWQWHQDYFGHTRGDEIPNDIANNDTAKNETANSVQESV